MSLLFADSWLVALRMHWDGKLQLTLFVGVKNFSRLVSVLFLMPGRLHHCTTGLAILERNYLDVYVYDKWEGHRVPEFNEGEEFAPSVCELRDGTTTKPKLLTEADLVTLMDKNGIGAPLSLKRLNVCLNFCRNRCYHCPTH
jgi:hypothetical protein